MSFFRYLKYGSIMMTGLATSTYTSRVIFTESDTDSNGDSDSKFSRVYTQFRNTFTWSKIEEEKEDEPVQLKPTDENSALYINSLKQRDDYQAPKYPIVLCHGISGFDKILLLPSFSLLSHLINGKAASDFDTSSEEGGLSLEYWLGIKEALKAKGSVVLVAKVPGFGSIEERAETLNEFITKNVERLSDKSKDEIYNSDDDESTDQKTFDEKKEKVKINLIAHSMGGLDCRYLISELEKKNYEVASLTTITTPHKGSEVADYLVNLANKVPAEISLPPSIYQLTTKYLSEFNEKVKDDPNVLYMSYGASFKPKWYNVFFGSWQIINQEAGDNDGMVSVESSKWGTYLGTLRNVDHLDLINWTNAFKRVVGSVGPLSSQDDQIDTLALYLDIADNLAKRGF